MQSKQSHRLQRDIQRLLTQLIQRDVDDPQLQMITITAVEITQGSHDAIIRVHAPDGLVEIDESVQRLNRMAGHFEHSIRRSLQRKRLPHLNFRWDRGMDQAAAMMDVLRNIQDHD